MESEFIRGESCRLITLANCSSGSEIYQTPPACSAAEKKSSVELVAEETLVDEDKVFGASFYRRAREGHRRQTFPSMNSVFRDEQ